MRAYLAAMIEFFRRTTPWWNALKDAMGRASAQAGEAESECRLLYLVARRRVRVRVRLRQHAVTAV